VQRRLFIAFVGLLPFVAAAQQAETPTRAAGAKERAFLSSLPAAPLTVVNQERALALATLPLSCVDHPQSLPEGRVDYLWAHDDKPRMIEGYDKSRVFYGCSDWHSAVHSLWALVYVAKQYPQIPVAALVRDRLKDHLGKKNVEGEIEFLKGAKRFEIPYGYAWVLKLYAELKTWEDPDAKTWTENLAKYLKRWWPTTRTCAIRSAAACIRIRRM